MNKYFKKLKNTKQRLPIERVLYIHDAGYKMDDLQIIYYSHVSDTKN